MSKQPSAPGRVSTRFAKPVGWVRDLPIWTKLGLIMIVPTLATIVVGTAGLLDNVQEANNADRARTLAVLAGDAGTLVHSIQDERALAVQLLNASGDNKAEISRLASDYLKQQGETEAAKVRYGQSRSTLADLPDSLRSLLDRVESQLGELPVMREQIESRTKIPRSVAERRYRVLVSDLLEIRDLAAQITGDTTLAERLRAAGAVANAKEFLSQERDVILQALADREMSEAVRRQFVSTRTGQELALASFAGVATPDQQQLLNRTMTGPELRATLNFEGGLDSLPVGRNPSTVVSMDTWDQSMRGRADLLNTVETTLNGQAQQAAIDLGSRVQRQVLIQTGLLLLTLLLGVIFAWLVARSMARSLRDLRQGALAVAQYGLPQAVARLRDPALSAHTSPATVAQQIAEPLPVRSKDEFGQVTEAFNAVHLEAVRTAAEQAALRASVATMFVNLARRSQILVDRLIGHLDRLERGEQDPDRLSELFQLDHLATRMRRNDENLLVLAGADSTRIQREPAALTDVLRAAQSEVEHYTRIEFVNIDHDIEIAAHAVNDLVHLVAELFDNATAFSPPDTSIIVEARRVGDRAVLHVEDRGIGMSPEQYSELNERLATPPMVDVAVSRMMGLVVVARLAARHGVKTELRPAAERGTVADVLMPSGVLVPRALAGRGQSPAGFPAVRPPTGPPRTPFGPPLALESGPVSAPSWSSGGDAWGSDGAAAHRPSGPPFQPPPAPFGAPPVPPAPAYGGSPSGLAGPGPSGPGHGGSGHSGSGLGAALSGSGLGATHGPGMNGTSNGSAGRMPAWYDLTGAGGAGGAGAPPATPTGPPGDSDPLPQRRPVWGSEPEALDAGPSVPRPTPPGDARSGPDYGYGYPPAPAASSLPPPAAYGSPPAAARPPVWPPVSDGVDDRGDGVPALPESFSASLDMTSELPRMRGQAGSGGTDPASPSRYADDLTMELPIFRELESAWFRAPTPPAADTGGWTDASSTRPYESGGGAMAGAAAAAAPSSADASLWPGGTGGSDGAAGGSGEVSWRTVADDGWLAAQSVAEQPRDGGSTDTGLPRRVPMAQLVPGGVEPVTGGSERRSPDAVRGLLSAYHRGVQRGRDAHGAAGEPTTTGSQTSGKEQEA